MTGAVGTSAFRVWAGDFTRLTPGPARRCVDWESCGTGRGSGMPATGVLPRESTVCASLMSSSGTPYCAGPVLDLNYSVENLSEVPFLGAWSMHPLLAAQPGMRILLPTGAKMVIDAALEEQGEERYRERIAWPWLGQDNGDEDLSSLRPASRGHALKLFTERHEVARAALCDPGTGAWVGVEVDRETVPHFGVWVNEGRWPVPEDRLYHVALEPTTGFADNLEIAAAVGSGAIVPALGALQWRVSLEFGTTADEAGAFVGGAA